MSEINEAAVIKALEGVKDPDLGRDLTELGMIKDIVVDGDTVRLTVDLTTPACPLKDVIGNDVKAAVTGKLDGINTCDVTFTSTVRPSQPTGSDLLPSVKNVVLIGSGKGGVGKSTVSANIACALAQTGAKVGMLDADIYGPSVPTAFGVQGERPDANPNQQIIPLVKYGMKLMSMGMLLEEGQPVVWRGPMLDGALRQFLGQVEWGDLDYLIIDLPPGTGDVQLSLGRMVPQASAVIVTTPQDIALSDVKRAFNMFKQVNIKTIGVIENMSTFICPSCGTQSDIFLSGGGQKAAELFGVELLGEVPLSMGVAEMTDKGTPVVIEDSDGPVGSVLKDAAGKIAQQVAIYANQNPAGATGAAMPDAGQGGHVPIRVPEGGSQQQGGGQQQAPQGAPQQGGQGFSRF